MRPAALLLLVVTTSTLYAAFDQANSWYKKGQDAEARQNYEQAYDDYKHAYDLKPKELRYRTSFERLRFLAGASHVHRGQLLREAGKLEEALAEFQKAAEIDSSSFIARQEIHETQRMIEQAKSPAPHSEAAPPGELEKRLTHAQGPVDLAPITNAPITLSFPNEDSKTIYETVGKLAGVNVLFDPDYTSRRIPVKLSGVTLPQALEIIAMESKTFWRVVTPNTIFVAQDTPAKRKEVEQSVVKTFFLANLSQATELQDLSNTLRQILDITKIQSLPSQNAIVVRGTPDQIALAEKLVDDFDRARPEVVIDVAILQVSRDKAHTLGINPPTSATVTLQNNINTTTPTSTTSTTTSTTTQNGISLNSLGNLNATDFQVTIPSASATALMSDSSTKVLQNPQIRSIDGQKASLKIGEKVPIATGSFQPGIGGVGINPLVNTQFTYQDVGVIIDVTPNIRPGGDVSMHIRMEVSSIAGESSIGGITQPNFGENIIEHTISLRDGEMSLLGGMYQDQNTKSLTGIPGLAQIPFLKYFFSQTQTDHSQSEIIFVLIPHIVRKVEFDDLSQRALSVGTATNIQLSQVTPPEPETTAVASNQAPAQMPAASPQPAQAAPAQASATSASASAPPASFSFDPANLAPKAGSTFAVNILLSGAQNVSSVPLQLSYDPKLLQVMDVSNGGFLSQDGQSVALVHRDPDPGGNLQITATRPPGANGVSGQGSVVTLTFMAKSSGQGTLVISRGGARDPAMQPIPVAGTTAAITVQ
jgi:general secretion pathway protein D